MANTYLTTTFQERLEVKALGARWDVAISKWYVPDGHDLALFSKWLPAGSAPVSPSTVVAPFQTGSTQILVARKKGSVAVSINDNPEHA